MSNIIEIFFKQRNDIKTAIIEQYTKAKQKPFAEDIASFEELSQDLTRLSDVPITSNFLHYFFSSFEFPILVRKEQMKALNTFTLDNIYFIDVSNTEGLEEIRKIAGTVYEGNDVIPLEVLKAWYAGNPNCFWLIRNAKNKNEVVGNVDVLPLDIDNAKVQDFLAGKIFELDMDTSCIVPPNRIHETKILYVESVVRKEGHRMSLKAVLQKARSIIRFISEYKDLDSDSGCKLYCIAASDEGIALIKHMGFEQKMKGEHRVDKHNLYHIPLRDFMNNVQTILSRNVGKEFDTPNYGSISL